MIFAWLPEQFNTYLLLNEFWVVQVNASGEATSNEVLALGVRKRTIGVGSSASLGRINNDHLSKEFEQCTIQRNSKLQHPLL